MSYFVQKFVLLLQINVPFLQKFVLFREKIWLFIAINELSKTSKTRYKYYIKYNKQDKNRIFLILYYHTNA